ncbi:MAG: molybdopterin converting factor subunit 1 [Betaproteobacteria bacterium]|nr:molybdopterin converting factor subunit 1 [Betaproteobacteria bacterium]
MRILYFARLREVLGSAEEQVEPPAHVTTVAALLAWLRERGGAFASELAEGKRFRVAVNQTVVNADAAVGAADEVAIFPPVTGG